MTEPRFLRFTARTVFGLHCDHLGSPVSAASSSLLLFARFSLASRGRSSSSWVSAVTYFIGKGLEAVVH